MLLDKQTFAEVIQNTPLVSIDLLVENARGEFLLGLRNNRPARGFWFAPGGRVLKGESLEAAFKRLTQAELGVEISLQQAEHQGLYEHFYSDNVFADESKYHHISTHYLVNAFKIKMLTTPNLPKQQHSEYKWLTAEKLLRHEQVHKYSKWYFQ